MMQTAVMFREFPGAGLAQLVERWFCKPPSFPLKIHQSLGFLRFPRPLVCEIPAPSERSAARKSAQSILSVSAPEENEDA